MLEQFYDVSYSLNTALKMEVFLLTLKTSADPQSMRMTGLLNGNETYFRYIKYIDSDRSPEWRLEVCTQHNPEFRKIHYNEDGGTLIVGKTTGILRREIEKMVESYLGEYE